MSVFSFGGSPTSQDAPTPVKVKEDEVVFFGLLGDLFPGLNPPRARDETLEANVVRACEELNLDPDDAFCLKCVQMKELLDIRHCVFLMGPAAAGKSECWRILAKARELMGPELKTGIWVRTRRLNLNFGEMASS